MTKAVNLTFPEGLKGANRIKDPMNKTIHMAIRKERVRKAKHAPRGPFNGIKGLDKLWR